MYYYLIFILYLFRMKKIKKEKRLNLENINKNQVTHDDSLFLLYIQLF